MQRTVAGKAAEKAPSASVSATILPVASKTDAAGSGVASTVLGIKKYENIWFIVFCTVFSHELVAAAVGVGWTLESVEH